MARQEAFLDDWFDTMLALTGDKAAEDRFRARAAREESGA